MNRHAAALRFRPQMTPLDDRVVPSAALVSDIVAGGVGSDPQLLTAVGGVLYFTAADGTNGRELWKTDGTAAGTVLVKDIKTGTGSSAPSDLTAVGSTLYFVADDGASGRELWKSDGTAAGTTLVKDINPSGGSLGSSPHLTAVGSTVFFHVSASDGTQDLWKSDGTVAGTVLLKDLVPGEFTSELVAFGGQLYFGFSAPLVGGGTYSELWKSNGTVPGTVAVTLIGSETDPGEGISAPHNFVAGQTRLFFTADAQWRDIETWVTDGSAGGTYEVDLSPDFPNDPHTSYPGQASYRDGYAPIYCVIGDVAYFSNAADLTGSEIIRLDGISGAAVNLGFVGGVMGTFGNLMYYSDSTTNLKVYNTVTGVSTTLVTGLAGPYHLTSVGGKVYFGVGVFSPSYGYELWETDGTPGGTQIVANINPTPYAGSNPHFMTVFNGTIYFAADNGTNGRELWKVVP